MTNMVFYKAGVVPVFKMAAGSAMQNTLPLPGVCVCACAVTNITVRVMISSVLFQHVFVGSFYM